MGLDFSDSNKKQHAEPVHSSARTPVSGVSSTNDSADEEARRDELLAGNLERQLDVGGNNAAPRDNQAAHAGAEDPEIHQLRPVVARMQDLANYLGADSLANGAVPLDAAPTAKDRRPAARATGTAIRTDSVLGGAAPGAGSQAGDRVGKYELLEKLGGGGQAVAWLALDPDLRRQVVLKIYHHATTPQRQEAVLGEGRALVRVRSPYVAQCYSAERHQGVPYLVMEFVPGQDLAHLHRAKPLTVGPALALLRQVADGLAAVHACGLLHLDIKPHNILVGHDGRPKLIDFGIAEHFGSDDLRRPSGTVAYMAPEQAGGQAERIDARTDLFGVGAVLYDLLTGRPPHREDTPAALWQAARAGDVVPPRERNPAVPAAVNALCLRCLAKDPAQRFASATDLAQALLRLEQLRRWTGADFAERVGQRAFRRILAVAALLLLALPVALWLWLGRTGDPNHGPQRSLPHVQPQPVPVPVAEAGPRLLDILPADKRPLRRDFPVTVEFTGKAKRPDGGYDLIADDKLALTVHVAETCYLGVWHVDDHKKIAQLYPNRFNENRQLKAGEPVAVNLEASESKRPEYIYVLASTRPWPAPATVRGTTGKDEEFNVVDEEELATTRGLTLITTERTSEVVIQFIVKPKAPDE